MALENGNFSSMVMHAMQYVDPVLEELEENGYVYHNRVHMYDVLARVTYLAQKENISSDFLEALQIAAVFHDVGMIVECRLRKQNAEKSDLGHEMLSAQEFDQYIKKSFLHVAMPEGWYFPQRYFFMPVVDDFFLHESTKLAVDMHTLIKDLIIATIPGNEFKYPKGHIYNTLEGIIKDADIDNLGREDFFEMGALVRQEIENTQGKRFSDFQRYTMVNKFFENLRFYTLTQISQRENMRELNMEKLQQLINDFAPVETL